jgi:hypothetical protein
LKEGAVVPVNHAYTGDSVLYVAPLSAVNLSDADASWQRIYSPMRPDCPLFSRKFPARVAAEVLRVYEDHIAFEG